jgi:O-antigen/teichoic acid export membrane protein
MRLRRALGWSFSQQAGLYALQFISLVVIARLMSPEEVGVFVVGLSASAILMALREAGLTSYLIREPRLTEGKIRTVSGFLALLSGALAILILLVSNPLAAAMKEPGVADVLAFVAAATILSAVELPALALLSRDMRFDLIHHVALAARSVGVILAITLAWCGASYIALAWGYLATAVVRALIFLKCEPRPFRLGLSLRGWREIFGFAGWMTGNAVAMAAATEAPKLILGAMIGTGPAALFDRGLRIPMLMRKGVFVPLARVVMPSFAKDLRAGRSIGPKVEKLAGATSALVWPPLLIVGLLSEPVVLLLFSEAWIGIAGLLPFLLMTAGLTALLPQAGTILLPHGRVRRLFLLSLSEMIVTLVIAAASVPFGLEVFIIVRVLGSALQVGLAWLAIRPYIGIGLFRLARVHAVSALAAVAAAGPLAALLWTIDAPVPAAIMGALALAPLLWFGVLRFLGHGLVDEMLHLRRWGLNALRG